MRTSAQRAAAVKNLSQRKLICVKFLSNVCLKTEGSRFFLELRLHEENAIFPISLSDLRIVSLESCEANVASFFNAHEKARFIITWWVLNPPILARHSVTVMPIVTK